MSWKRGFFSSERLAVCSRRGDRAGTLRVLDLVSGGLSAGIHIEGEVYAFCPERGMVASAGRTMAGGESASDIYVADIKSGKRLWSRSGQPGRIAHLEFSPDGRTLAATVSGGVGLWDVNTGALRHTLASDIAISAVAFSPDGELLAAACSRGIGIEFSAMKVWNTETGALKCSLAGHTDYTYSIAFSPDGRTVASSGRFQEVFLWDTDKRQLIRKLDRAGDAYIALAFSCDGALLACGTGGKSQAITVWRTNTGQLVRLLKNHNVEIPFAPAPAAE